MTRDGTKKLDPKQEEKRLDLPCLFAYVTFLVLEIKRKVNRWYFYQLSNPDRSQDLQGLEKKECVDHWKPFAK